MNSNNVTTQQDNEMNNNMIIINSYSDMNAKDQAVFEADINK
jgi:hypothetical protein